MEGLTARHRPPRPSGVDRGVGQSGFSLIELLVAVLIVAFVVIGVLSAFGHAVSLNSSSRDYTAVSNLAKSQLEELTALPFAAPELAAGTHPPAASADDRFTISYTVQEFAITSQQADPDTVMAGAQVAGGGNIKRVTLTVAPRHNAAPGLREVTVEGVKHVR